VLWPRSGGGENFDTRPSRAPHTLEVHYRALQNTRPFRNRREKSTEVRLASERPAPEPQRDRRSRVGRAVKTTWRCKMLRSPRMGSGGGPSAEPGGWSLAKGSPAAATVIAFVSQKLARSGGGKRAGPRAT